MNAPLTFPPGLREGADYPSPVTRVLALGYYDGPTNGVLQCGDGGSVYKFDLIEGPFSIEDGLWDMRVFVAAPLPGGVLAQLAEAYSRFWAPRWPVWVPMWHFADPAEEQAMNRLTDEVLRQAGSVEWAIATTDLLTTIRAARAVTAEDLARVSDWLAFLRVQNEATPKA
jgi:hypothetical protein